MRTSRLVSMPWHTQPFEKSSEARVYALAHAAVREGGVQRCTCRAGSLTSRMRTSRLVSMPWHTQPFEKSSEVHVPCRQLDEQDENFEAGVHAVAHAAVRE